MAQRITTWTSTFKEVGLILVAFAIWFVARIVIWDRGLDGPFVGFFVIFVGAWILLSWRRMVKQRQLRQK